jgi:hypothetical protein
VRSMRLSALALGAAFSGWMAGAAAQPAPAKKTPEVQARVYYDLYEASRRFPTRLGGCQEDSEQPLGSFCVRLCKAGYLALDDAKAGLRQCRSQKPLPPGQLPASGQKETSTQPVKKSTAERPGT